MANNKKVQVEIDRLLKKTMLCLTEYDEMNTKFKSEPAQNTAAKERLAGDLKKEIKKLQRQRDQIKSFIANPEVKDVKQLESSLKKIEERMEGFRSIERATKTKAFSKEGLSAAAEDTPLAHTISWLKRSIEEGRKRAEILDYEAQKAAKGGRRGKKSEEKLKLDRLRTHMQKWDVLLRMLNNEEVACEDVDPIQEKIESLLAEDCDVDELGNMDLYEPFYMPEGGRGRTDEDDDEEVPDWMDDDGAIDETFGDDAVADAPMGSLADMAKMTTEAANDFERKKDAFRKEAAVAATKKETPAQPAAAPARTPEKSPAKPPPPNDWEKRKLELKKDTSAALPPSASAAAATATAAAAAVTTAAAAAAAPPAEAPAQPAAAAPAAAAPAAASPPAAPAAAAQPSPAAEASASTSVTPSSPAQAANHRYDLATTLGLLDVSLANLPHTLDMERHRPFEPPNAIEPIPYFPTEVDPILSCKDIYSRFDLETLFFIFYYHQKSYQQYFAAKELKKNSFRYHTEQKRWYQRRERPVETTADSERGAYTYFDYEDTFKKQDVTDFVFKYEFLEDELK